MPGFFQRHRKLLWGGIISFVILAGLAAIIPSAVHTRCARPENSCINNLRQIDGAKEQWALETQQTNNAPANISEINEYIKGGQPKCYAGGTYTYGNIDEPPRCTIKSHTLTPNQTPPKS